MTANISKDTNTEKMALPISGTKKQAATRALALPVAALITGGLFLAMEGMISSDFEAQEKRAVASFEINPVVKDIVIDTRTDKPDLLTVEVPPAPPVLDMTETQKPVENPVELDVDIKLELPEPDIFTASIEIDRDPGPIVRIPPIMPPRFTAGRNSGYCEMRFDVNPQGQPFNIDTALCTNRTLRNAAIKAVQKWKYNPKIVSGIPVAQTGFKTRITFELKDEFGTTLPMPKGY